MTVDATFADERPDLVADLVATVQRVAGWANDNPAEAVRFIAREIGVSEEAVIVANGADVYRSLRLDLDPAELDALSHFKDFLLEWKFIPDDFDVNDWADPRALSLLQQAAAK